MKETAEIKDYIFEDYSHFKNYVSYMFIKGERNDNKFDQTSLCFALVCANNKKGYGIVPKNDKENYIDNLYNKGKREGSSYSAQTLGFRIDDSIDRIDSVVDYLSPVIDRLVLLRKTNVIRDGAIGVHIGQKKSQPHAHILVDSLFDFDYLNVLKNGEN